MTLNTEKAQKILIIKLAAIGDILFASPLVENLRRNFVNIQIDWLADSWTKEALDHIPNLNKVIFYDRPWLRKWPYKGYLEVPFLIRQLRKANYDIAIIPHRSAQAFKLAKLAGITFKVGFFKKTESASKYLDLAVKFDSKKHEVERNLDLLRAMGLKVESNAMAFNIDKSIEEAVKKNFLKELKGSKFVTIGPGGGKNPGLSMTLKRWPEQYYLALANKISDRGYKAVLVGSDNDTEICKYIAKYTDVINLCGRTNLAETAAVIKQSILYIGNDSAPLYIAAAIGATTLGLFGPTDATLLAPLSKNSFYCVSNVDCQPCYSPQKLKRGSYDSCQFDKKCLKELNVEVVFKQATEILNKDG